MTPKMKNSVLNNDTANEGQHKQIPPKNKSNDVKDIKAKKYQRGHCQFCQQDPTHNNRRS